MGYLEGEMYSKIRKMEEAGRKTVEDLESRLRLVEADAIAQQRVLETQLEEGKAREASLLKRLQETIDAEEALAARIAELEAETYGLMAASREIALNGRNHYIIKEIPTTNVQTTSDKGDREEIRPGAKEENAATPSLRAEEGSDKVESLKVEENCVKADREAVPPAAKEDDPATISLRAEEGSGKVESSTGKFSNQRRSFKEQQRKEEVHAARMRSLLQPDAWPASSLISGFA
ncbi:hypothetical protein KP509_12G023400 [Ceratopteris richardii]|nr:hypothetical protein KP509_12G023400 [Ceratopteris richardii]